ncbi:hypothetical protein M0R45_013950 [Rubus argutus]|uniref:Pentatricopeptide repeat-containing protein n=1 Tax=Rubus argutus TaxID=59490 RepID=A0AAW1XM61_RUBAR
MCMVRSFAEIGRFKEAADMVFEMQNQGLMLSTRTLNCVLGIAWEMGLVEFAENMFDEINGRVVEADRWLNKMIERGFVVDNTTFTLIISMFCERGFVSRASWCFDKMSKMGVKPNLVNFTSLIHGLCKRGSVKQAFEMLEEMVRRGWKPNVYTHTALIDGLCKKVMDSLCKKGRAQEAYKLIKKGFRRGLQADRVTYTIFISEHCRRADIKGALAFFNKIIKVGLEPDIHSYTTLIAAFCRQKKMKESEKLFEGSCKAWLDSNQGNLYIHDMWFYLWCSNKRSLQGGEKLDEARKLYDTMMDKGLSPCEVTRLTLAHKYCQKDDYATAMVILERLEKKLWIRTVNTLVRKLCSEKKVGIAALFFHKLVDKNQNVDRVTLQAFMTACYESNKYALVSDLTERISKGIG